MNLLFLLTSQNFSTSRIYQTGKGAKAKRRNTNSGKKEKKMNVWCITNDKFVVVVVMREDTFWAPRLWYINLNEAILRIVYFIFIDNSNSESESESYTFLHAKQMRRENVKHELYSMIVVPFVVVTEIERAAACNQKKNQKKILNWNKKEKENERWIKTTLNVLCRSWILFDRPFLSICRKRIFLFRAKAIKKRRRSFPS